MKKSPLKLPDTPGVYIFRGSRHAILYIGKATSLRSRVQSYFRRDLINARGPIIAGMVEIATNVQTIVTDSVLEALILEAHLIKKHQPPYNTKEKDDRSFNFAVITQETYPRIFTMRERELEIRKNEIKYAFGPFPQGAMLREALRIIRKIFPFRDKCTPYQGKRCFNAQIGLCPGICAGEVSRREYLRTIARIVLFFQGKKNILVKNLKRDMGRAAKSFNFEEAGCLKRTLFALTHIHDVALLKRDIRHGLNNERSVRIEAYDVAHISGTATVGAMIVLENGEPQKKEYRRFKIQTSTNDDIASLREMLTRRLVHTEWNIPALVVVDGGEIQLSTARKIISAAWPDIAIVGVIKDERHRAREIIGDTNASVMDEQNVLLANNEAHRFAIAYHRTIRGNIPQKTAGALRANHKKSRTKFGPAGGITHSI